MRIKNEQKILHMKFNFFKDEKYISVSLIIIIYFLNLCKGPVWKNLSTT